MKSIPIDDRCSAGTLTRLFQFGAENVGFASRRSTRPLDRKKWDGKRSLSHYTRATATPGAAPTWHLSHDFGRGDDSRPRSRFSCNITLEVLRTFIPPSSHSSDPSGWGGNHQIHPFRKLPRSSQRATPLPT